MKDSRHVEILQELDRKSVVSVKELKELFGVTDMTIRRDLIDLEKQGLLVRVHGGAHKKVKDSLLEASHSEKNLINIDEKRSIAKKMCRLDRKWGYRLYWLWYNNRLYRRLFGRERN